MRLLARCRLIKAILPTGNQQISKLVAGNRQFLRQGTFIPACIEQARLTSGSFCTNLIPSGKENTAEAPADNTLPSISSPNGYQRLAMHTNDGKMTERLSNPAMEPGWDLGGIMEGCLGLSGESEELVDLIKKWIFHEKTLNEEHAKKELGDVLWYTALICESFGWKMEDVMALNIDKLRKRYPDGFNPVQANNRAENDV